MAYIQFAITFNSLKYTGDRQFEKSVQYIRIYNSGTCRYQMLTDLPKYYCELRYNFIPAIIKGILAVQYGKAKLINLMKMFSKYFAEMTINIANFCITCNGSIAVQSLKKSGLFAFYR